MVSSLETVRIWQVRIDDNYVVNRVLIWTICLSCGEYVLLVQVFPVLTWEIIVVGLVELEGQLVEFYL